MGLDDDGTHRKEITATKTETIGWCVALLLLLLGGEQGLTGILYVIDKKFSGGRKTELGWWGGITQPIRNPGVE